MSWTNGKRAALADGPSLDESALGGHRGVRCGGHRMHRRAREALVTDAEMMEQAWERAVAMLKEAGEDVPALLDRAGRNIERIRAIPQSEWPDEWWLPGEDEE